MSTLSRGLWPKKPPDSVRVASQRSLARDSLQSRLSLNDKGDKEMMPGAVHRSPDIYLTTEEIPGNPQLLDCLTKAARPAMSSDGVPYPSKRGRQNRTERQERRRKERRIGQGWMIEADTFFCVHMVVDIGQNSLMLVLGCLKLLSEFLTKCHLP